MITDSEDRSMIAELERIIKEEETKPEAERDANLIDECIREIADLKGVRSDFSDEEIGKITDKLVKATEQEKKRKRFIRLAAGIAAAFVIVSGVTACATNPALINWFMKIVRMPIGTSMKNNKITYINQGVDKEYCDVLSLISHEHLDIFYPSVMPNNEAIQYIEVIEQNDQRIIAFDFTKENLHFLVEIPCGADEREQKVLTEIESNDFHFDVYQRGNIYIAIIERNGVRYVIQTDEMNDIITIIGGLKTEET